MRTAATLLALLECVPLSLYPKSSPLVGRTYEALDETRDVIEGIDSQLAQIMNDWDFGLITSSPTSTDDFGSIV